MEFIATIQRQSRIEVEYFAQRREGVKVRKQDSELCALAAWREEILILMSYGDQRILRKLRKLRR